MMKIYIRKREEKIMRKRLLYVMLAFVLVSVLTLAGCGESETESLSDVLALDALETVWNSYGEDERFPVSGGMAGGFRCVLTGIHVRKFSRGV